VKCGTVAWLLFPLLASCSGGPEGGELWTSLSGEWRFQGSGSSAWYPAEVPGTVHTDLMAAHLIPDPYVDMNADSVQWVGERDWIYERAFDITPDILDHEEVELVFKGLDTFAEVRLNDSLVGVADNMFRSWTFPVKGSLVAGRNRLRVTFRSALKRGEELLRAYGRSLPADNDGGTVKVSPFVRKAGVHFGWDFAPRLVTCGIWQEVGLRAWSGSRIGSVRLAQRAAKGKRTLRFHVDLCSQPGAQGEVVLRINGRELSRSKPPDGSGWRTHDIELIVPDTGLWWPLGSGEQRLQSCTIDLVLDGVVCSSWHDRIGLRTIALNQKPDGLGKPFTFLVNGAPLFAKGANLVPPDMFLPRAGDSAWVHLVNEMATCHMNMVRVWGGGVYPPDAFFEACDSAGILVWQDLMFANTMVPDDDAFMNNVREEVEEQVKRLQHHACLALWCGNNEVDVAWHNWGWQRSYAISPADSSRMWKAYTGLFEQALPQWIWVLDEYYRYTSTSPLSNWGNPTGLRNGDLHYWGVWHADSTFASFRGNTGRFVSEYGFQSYPDSSTLAHYIDPGQLHLGSPYIAYRQRSYRTDRPITIAIRRELGKEARTLGEFCQASQEVQAIAYREAIIAHRAARPACMGTLLWQLNDVWPGPSWSIIDHDGRRKLAFGAVREIYSDGDLPR